MNGNIQCKEEGGGGGGLTSLMQVLWKCKLYAKL